MNTEAYRSGHNGPDSKSGSPHGLVGSNPTASAILRQELPNGFSCLNCYPITEVIFVKRIAKLISAGLIMVMLLFTAFSFLYVPTGNVEDVEFVTESLSNYLLGYMSWGIKHMGLDKLQTQLENSGKSLPEVKVAVIDSGLYTSNKYFEGRYTNDGYSFLDNSTDITDEQYHGTMVSGIIVDGTSSNVKILPIKVNDKNGRGNMSNVSKGIFYAIEHNADVINLSLSSEDPKRSITILDEAIEAAVAKGIVVVVASGNHSGDASYRYPANKDNVITITSIDKKDKIADTANTGAVIDFALPGVNVFAPYKSYAYVQSGTSLAAPHAAAAVALLKTWDKTLNQSEIVEILKRYTVDLGAKGFDETYGWGMIDLSSFDIKTAERPTQPPTEAPTAAPTEAETTAPTTATEAPTSMPTTAPTDAPTTVPTTAPTDAPTIAPTSSPTQEPTYAPTEPSPILGDVDGDGVVTIIDVTALQRVLAGIPTSSYNEAAADADNDGFVNLLDATFIQRVLAGII